MENENIYCLLSEILVEEFNFKKESINLSETTNINDLGFDSFQIVELMYEVERRLGIKIRNEELSNIKTISALVKLINEKKEQNEQEI